MNERNRPTDTPPPKKDSPDPDNIVSPDDSSLTEYDKELADSFPASDPPAQP